MCFKHINSVFSDSTDNKENLPSDTESKRKAAYSHVKNLTEVDSAYVKVFA